MLAHLQPTGGLSPGRPIRPPLSNPGFATCRSAYGGLDVQFADGARRNLADGVVPFVLPAAADLRTFLGQLRGDRIQLGVATAGVVWLAARPVGVTHLIHARTVAARPGARSILPRERRVLVVEVDALAGRPEHLLTTVSVGETSARGKRGVYNDDSPR